MKTALITGTSYGLGEEIALLLLENGWKIIGVSRTENKKLLHSSNFSQILIDISDKEKVIESFESMGEIHCVINNAAIFKLDSFENTKFDEIENLIKTNVLGSMYVTKATLSSLVENSKIIFINSVAGLNEFEGQSIYCASKHALTAFSAVLSKELKNRKIKTVSIHPGGINTPLWSKTEYPLGDTSKALDAQDIAKMILYILNSPDYIEYKTVTMFPEIENH
jgi:NADP-dependent 3-hydroxy acid dehydrogenase YdfG